MKREEEEEDDDDDMVWLDESFFINDDYKMSTFSFGSQVIHLLCLQSASTDYDLTGQLVWPGAVLLNNYLSNNTAILQGCSIIELGSGVVFKSFLVVEGVTGILCSRFCHEILLTDHNEQVLKILKKNIELQPSHENHTNYAGLAAEKLEWGNVDDLSLILQRYPRGFDLILGADIYFQQSSIPPLFTTVERLLRHRGAAGSKFILAYVSRAKTMDVMVLNEAVKHGLQVREVEGTRSVVSNLEGVIFEIKLL
ncbi:hypothetical protein Scep_017565 [Stephania cephalantha]|uniref:Protein N-lysine methyltransferase METTL21A n=1 Tax=Stephania cephalantha TaxID=152367 RepID=A0AAP0IPU0_9MAGN